MDKDVFVTIKGIHTTNNDSDDTEILIPVSTILETTSILYAMKRYRNPMEKNPRAL